MSTIDSPTSTEDLRKEALRRAIATAGGQVQLAEAIGTTQQKVSYWLSKAKKGVPGEFCIRIEEKTGEPRWALRPDIYPAPCKPQNSEISS